MATLVLSLFVSTVPALHTTVSHPARRICRPGPSVDARVLIIGDSISLGQMGDIQTYLEAHGSDGPVTAVHAPYSSDGGALDSKYAMDATTLMTGAGSGPPWISGDSLPKRYGDGCLNSTFLVSATQEPLKFDVISFNFGVHDVEYGGARDNDAYAEEWVPFRLYESNIRAIKHTLQATGAKVVFQASTPVEYNLTTNARILAYNAAAKAVMAESPIAAYNDAYGDVVAVCGPPPYNAPHYPNSSNCSISDYNGVHYHPLGWQLLGNSTARSVLALLNQKQSVQEEKDLENKNLRNDVVICNATALFAEASEQVATDNSQSKVLGHSFDKNSWNLADAVLNAQPTSCPLNSTCMVTAFSSTMLGCCMGYGPNAVACADHAHCCPKGWTCEKGCKLGRCSCIPPNTFGSD